MVVVAVVVFVLCVHPALIAVTVVVAGLQERVLSAVCEQWQDGYTTLREPYFPYLVCAPAGSD